MRIAPNFLLKKIDGQHIIIPIGNAGTGYTELITVGEVGTFLWEQLQTDRTEEELVQSILREYEVAEEVAREDIRDFIEALKNGGVLV